MLENNGAKALEELYLLGGGIDTYGKSMAAPALQEHFTLAVILAGKGKLDIGNTMMELEKEDVFVVFPQCKMRLRGEGLRCAKIIFDGPGAATYLEYIGFTTQKEPVQRSNLPCEVYLSMIEDMLRLPDFTMQDRLLQTGALYKLFATLVEAQRVEGRAGVARYDYPQEVYVATLKEHIARQYSYVRISDLAEYMGVNRSYLTVMFKKETGMSPQKYLMNYRMVKAAEMLRGSDATLKEIARRVGYADPFTFSKTFKAHYGVSPSFYRESEEEGRNANPEF